MLSVQKVLKKSHYRRKIHIPWNVKNFIWKNFDGFSPNWQQSLIFIFLYQEQVFFYNIFKIYWFFNWRITALQNFVVSCHTSTWISHRDTYMPSLLNPAPISLPITPPRLTQSPCLSFLSQTANSCRPSLLHKVM